MRSCLFFANDVMLFLEAIVCPCPPPISTHSTNCFTTLTSLNLNKKIIFQIFGHFRDHDLVTALIHISATLHATRFNIDTTAFVTSLRLINAFLSHICVGGSRGKGDRMGTQDFRIGLGHLSYNFV